MHGSVLSLCTQVLGITCQATGRCILLWFVAVQVFEGFQFLDEGFVLVFQHGHAVLQTLHVLFLLPTALAGCLPVRQEAHISLTPTEAIEYELLINLAIPVFHQSDLPFACDFLSGSWSADCGWSCHDHPRSDGAGGGCADLIGLDITRSSWWTKIDKQSVLHSAKLYK